MHLCSRRGGLGRRLRGARRAMDQVFEPEHEEKGLRAAVWGVSFFVLSVFVGSPLLFLVEHLRGKAMV